MDYNSETYLHELSDRLAVYIPNTVADAPDDASRKELSRVRRRQALIFKAFDAKCKCDDTIDLYDLQLRGQAIVADIGVSQMVGMNETVVPYFVAEYKKLKEILGQLNSEYKRLNQFPEIKEEVTPFKVKELSSLLYDDLTQLCTEYNIDCDIKQLVKGI